ncbi:MAG: lysophospholipid acyltransferase family protein [Rhodobacteraceae bacterium]|nr:lysophospholipid acyltransferase family protein [Paracoccaceae bacterium]
MARPRTTNPTLADRLSDAAFRLVLSLARTLPYRHRVPVAGWLISRIVAPLAGYSRRVRDNLALVRPDLPAAEVRRLMRAVPDNVGRTMIEIYSGRDFTERLRDLPITGPGGAALEAAHREGRPVILATGHFGNYDVARAALIARGYQVGALYKPMNNPLFNAHYLDAISAIGTPLFPRGNRGLAEMVRFLKSGGMLGLLMDQHMAHGAPLSFFGETAHTATSAADLALKYGADLIPIYGIRQPDGLSFTILAEAVIPPSDPLTMTQAINDSLEALVRQHMDQWFWIHRRWK